MKTYLACILLIFSTKVLPVLKLPEILPSNCSSVFLGGLHAHKGLSGLQKKNYFGKFYKTRQSKHCGFCIYIFDNQLKSMVRLVRAEMMVLSGLVFARKIARMISIRNVKSLMGPLMINIAFRPLYM